MKNGYHTINPENGLEEYVIPHYKIVEAYSLDLFIDRLEKRESSTEKTILFFVNSLKELGFEIIDKDKLY